MRLWLAGIAFAIVGSVLLGLVVDLYEPTRAFFIEDGPVEWLQAGLLLAVAIVFAATFPRSGGSRALFCLLASYACIFALTREIPRCGSSFSNGGACLTSGWKETIVLAASALGLVVLVLRPIDWRDARRLSNLRWIWPSFVIAGLLFLAEALEDLVYYSEIEEFFELIAYLYLAGFALAIRRGTGRPRSAWQGSRLAAAAPFDIARRGAHRPVRSSRARARRGVMQHSNHHPVFIVLSVLIAILGSWTALDLFRRVAENVGRTRIAWLATAALVMGMSIWSMHFVAMLGFDPGSAVSYDPSLTVASLVLAIGSTAGAFFFVASESIRSRQIVLAGAVMGIGICTMHYVGMAALETAVSLGYDVGLVILSLVIAVLASTAALFAARRERSARTQAFAALILGLAVAGMHYTAMAALHLTPLPDRLPDRLPALHGAPPLMLAIGVATLTVLILFLALMASLYDQRGNILAALEAGGVGYWELDLRSRVLHISPKGKAIFGLLPEDGLTYAEALTRIAPDSRAERARQLAHAIASGTDYDIEYPLARERRWVNARGRVAASRAAHPVRMVGVVLDVTDRRNAFIELETSERRQRLLIDELNHRVKNTLATVQSISRQTAKRATSLEQFHADFEARVMALSATHNALTRGGWEKASLREILENELRPYASGPLRLSGEDVDLPARHALSLGMVFHELATNAAKHGGLSTPAGRLEIAWTVEAREDGPVLELTWSEFGCSIDGPPASRGFGTRLIQTSVEHELSGRTRVVFGPDGLRCAISVPMRPASPAMPPSA